jgi:hypothetical protein
VHCAAEVNPKLPADRYLEDLFDPAAYVVYALSSALQSANEPVAQFAVLVPWPTGESFTQLAVGKCAVVGVPAEARAARNSDSSMKARGRPRACCRTAAPIAPAAFIVRDTPG